MQHLHIQDDQLGIAVEAQPGVGILKAFATAAVGIPANGAVGYAPGCILVNTANGNLYLNTGTLASCNFKLFSPFTQPTYNTNAATSSTTGLATDISGSFGAGEVYLNLTGTLGAGANYTLPTVASLVAALTNPVAGQAYRLRIINSSGGAFTWTVLTNTGWTLNGTMTIAQNTWRDFVLTLTSLTAATLQAVGTGTQS